MSPHRNAANSAFNNMVQQVSLDEESSDSYIAQLHNAAQYMGERAACASAEADAHSVAICLSSMCASTILAAQQKPPSPLPQHAYGWEANPGRQVQIVQGTQVPHDAVSDWQKAAPGQSGGVGGEVGMNRQMEVVRAQYQSPRELDSSAR